MSRSSRDQPKAVICCTVELPSSPAVSAPKSAGAIWILCLRSHAPYGALAAFADLTWRGVRGQGLGVRGQGLGLRGEVGVRGEVRGWGLAEVTSTFLRISPVSRSIVICRPGPRRPFHSTSSSCQGVRGRVREKGEGWGRVRVGLG
jgi:hypothetical protein